MSMGQAGAVNAADTAASATDMSMGQAGAVNAAASTPAAPTPAAPTPAASPAKPAANKSMSPAIAAYASRMGLLTNNKPNVDAIKKFQTANGLTADGIIGPNTAGAILSAQKPGGPAANLRGPASAQERSSYAKAPPANMTGQAATAAPAGQAGSGSDKIRAEIDRFKSKNNMSLQANKEYVARLQAKLDAAAPAGQAAQPSATATTAAGAASKVNPMPDPNRRTGTIAQRDEWMSKYGKTHNQDGTPKSSNQAAAPAGQVATPTTSGGRPVAAPAARTFEESVDMMRRLSTMLKG
jgi:peptidoglycan hydrolase-like protein with peptidoglycan-binding domain